LKFAKFINNNVVINKVKTLFKLDRTVALIQSSMDQMKEVNKCLGG
jgi:hypothetical protein